MFKIVEQLSFQESSLVGSYKSLQPRFNGLTAEDESSDM